MLGSQFGKAALRYVGDGVALLEELALELCAGVLANPEMAQPLPHLLGSGPTPFALASVLSHLQRQLVPRFLACGTAERQAFLAGLNGQRIAAGPSGAPTRGRPDVLPTGRNFYSVDLRGLPTEAAWDLGRRSAELLLESHLQQDG